MAKAQPENPYLAARTEWMERYGELATGKRNWQVVAAALSVLSLVLAVGLVALSLEQKVVPYVVEVDRLGLIGSISKADASRVTDPKLIRYLLTSFIRNARQISPDGLAMKQLLDDAYAYTRGAALQTLNEYYSERKPFELAKSQSVQVEVSSLLPVSAQSWKIRWIETTRALDGKHLSRTNWEAYLTTENAEPSREEEIRKNPLGLYIVQLSWTRQL